MIRHGKKLHETIYVVVEIKIPKFSGDIQDTNDLFCSLERNTQFSFQSEISVFIGK